MDLVTKCVIMVVSIALFWVAVEILFLLFLRAFRLIDNYFQDQYWKKINDIIKK